MPSAIDVARYLIHLGAQEEECDLLSPMRLQKLLYYVQGWHVGAFGRVLFDEPLEAWRHGPVVKSVYNAFKSYGDEGIPPGSETETEPSALSLGDRAFIESVWQEYKKYSASGLRCLTHDEPPWRQARGGLPDEASCTTPIATDDLSAFFAPLAAKRLLLGISVEDAYAGYEQFQRGQGRPVKEVFARIRARHAV